MQPQHIMSNLKYSNHDHFMFIKYLNFCKVWYTNFHVNPFKQDFQKINCLDSLHSVFQTFVVFGKLTELTT